MSNDKNEKYTCLKNGWILLSDLCKKYNKERSNLHKILKTIDENDKELLGKTWVVRENEFIKKIKIDEPVIINETILIDELIDKFTNNLFKLDLETIQSNFKNIDLKDNSILKLFSDWAFICETSFPVELYAYVEKGHDLYIKTALIHQLLSKHS